MVKTLKLAFMDFDGTITRNTQIDGAVRAGIKKMHANGVATTIATGKGYKQLNHRLGADLASLVSINMPISLENGGRIVGPESTNVFFHPLSAWEIEAVEQVVSSFSKSISAVAYHPENPNSNMVVWSPNGKNLSEIVYKDLPISDVCTLDSKHFFKKVLEDNPCMIIVAANEDNLYKVFPKMLNVVTNEGVVNINAEGISKGTAVLELSELLGIDVPNILVAGNDKNDLPLMLSQAGIKIWVGDVPSDLEVIGNILNYPNPTEFGNYLNSL